MATTAGAILDKAAVLLNDQLKKTWTHDVLLPHLVDSFDALVQELESVGAPVVKEVSSVLPVLAGATTLAVPADLVEVITLSERTRNSSEDFFPMYEKDWIPDIPKTEFLRYWQWREQILNLVGALGDREVKIQYIKSLADITTENSAIDVINSTRFLQYNTAALAAGFRGENAERAKFLFGIAQAAVDKLKREACKSLQGLPIRRRPYKYSSKF
jgi:hypothetical protein